LRLPHAHQLHAALQAAGALLQMIGAVAGIEFSFFPFLTICQE